MSKTHALQKPLILALTLLITTSLILNSCKKDNREASDSKLTTLKQWYQNNISLKSNSDFKDLEPIWQTAYINNQEKYTVYEINLSKPDALVLPFTTTNIKAEAARANLRLLIFEDKVSRKIKFASYMYIENDNKQDFGKLHYRSLEKLTGKVFFYHQNGKMANGWIYQNGNVVSLTSPTTEKQYLLMAQGKRGGLASEKLMNAGDQECNSAKVETFFWGCVTAGTTKTCGWHSKGFSYITICRTINASGDETTIDYIAPPDYGGYWPDSVDCFGDVNGTAIMTEECGCTGGNTGIDPCPPVVEVKQDSLQKYYPCMVKEILNKLLANSSYGKLIQPFQSIQLPNGSNFSMQGLPNLTFSFSSQDYGGTSNKYMLGNTGNKGTSSEIEFNSSAISNASQLFLQMAAIHEVGHAYANYYIKAGTYGHPVDTTRYSTWAMNIVNFDVAARNRYSNGNFTDHSLFIENYVDNFVKILKELNGSTYTNKQYQMAALYGLNNAGDAPSSPITLNGVNVYDLNKAILTITYNNLLTKYSITAAERDAFYLDNLKNVPIAKKLPTSCP